MQAPLVSILQSSLKDWKSPLISIWILEEEGSPRSTYRPQCLPTRYR